MDPRIRLLLWLSRRKYGDFDPRISPARFRKAYAETNRRFGLRDRGGVRTEDAAVPVAGGTIPARIYRPDGAVPPAAALLFFHGGGFVIGDIDSYDHLARFFAREGELIVVSVGYRRGPEHRFPQAHEDAFAALAWLQAHSGELGIDPRRIAVGGDSAGGNLAAALSALSVQRGHARPAFQLLIYPAVDALREYPSVRTHSRRLPLTPITIDYFAAHYGASLDDARSALLSPLRAPRPEELPPTYVLAAKYDPLLDEGRAYADRLTSAGVPVTYDLCTALPHAFVNFAGIVPSARRALRRAIRTSASALHIAEAPP